MERNQTFSKAVIVSETDENTVASPFILGNTTEMEMQILQDDYLVPVFSRDNNETISHTEFINTICDAAQTYFQGEQFAAPVIRTSHEMKLRTRAGSGKLVEQLSRPRFRLLLSTYDVYDRNSKYIIQRQWMRTCPTNRRRKKLPRNQPFGQQLPKANISAWHRFFEPSLHEYVPVVKWN